MIFYHYTARERLAEIMKSSLSIGDVPLSAGEGLNAVWLTRDSSPLGHGLGEAREMTDQEREKMKQLKGVLVAPGMRWLNKREVCIRIKLPERDRKLKHWLTWSNGRMDARFRDVLVELGGGKKKARSWYIYFGEIYPFQFDAVFDVEERANVQRRINNLNRRFGESDMI